MLPDYYSQNMAVLKEIYPQLAEIINNSGDHESSEDNKLKDEDLKIETAASGAVTLICRGLYVHSKRDPQREAERLVDAAGGDAAYGETAGSDKDPALILGFGLGYTAMALAAKFPGRPIIVAEKRAELLKKALEARDMKSFLSRNGLVFVLGGSGDGVTEALSLFESTPGAPPLVLQNRAVTVLDEDWYAGVEERIKTWFTRTNVNRATQQRFGKRWIKNLSRNLKAVRDIPGISRLEGLLSKTGIPVFLAAAGPSLDLAEPILKEVHKRCVIVAVDTSLRFLSERGIEADFVVSVDPQYWNFRHLDRVRTAKTRLVSESAVYPPLLRLPFERIFLCASFFPLGRFIEEYLEQKGVLGAGGSVATSAWDFARHLGAEKVWIAGLDLSFPGLKTHFRGAVFEERSHAESKRFNPRETWNFRVLRDGHPFFAKSRNRESFPGIKVLTDKRLSLYAAWFESRFSQFPLIKNLSLSDDGLEIKGLETASTEDLLALPERREKINELLDGLNKTLESDFFNENAKKLRAEKYEKARSALLDGLGQIKNLAMETAENAGIAASRCKQGRLEKKQQEQVIKTLDAANKALSQSAVKDIAGFLFPETENWETEIAAVTADPLARYLEFNARFYEALAETADYTFKTLTCFAER